MASAPVHPDWSGLQAVEHQTPYLEVAPSQAEKEATQQPTEYFGGHNDKFPRASPGLQDPKFLFAPTGRDSKMVDPAGGSVTSPSSSNYSEEKQLQQARFLDQSFQQGHVPPPPQGPRKRSRRRLWTLVGLIVLIIAIVIAVPCGVILSRQAQSNTSSGTTPSPATSGSPQASVVAPYNGTRFATLEPPSDDKLWLFWQDEEGSIRLSKFNATNMWEAPTNMSLKNVAKGTPLAAVTHYSRELPGGLNHLVYYTADGYYAGVINDPSKGDAWTDDGFYGELRRGPEDPHFDMAWAENNDGTAWLYLGGALSGWINQATFDIPTQAWEVGALLFPGTSVYGGISAQQSGNLTQLHVVSPHAQYIVSWVRDLGNATDASWTRIADPLSGIAPNTSLAAPHIGGDPTLLYYQAPNGSVQVARWSGLGLNATWLNTTDVGVPAMEHSYLHVSTLPIDGANETTVMFLQEQGDDLTIYTGSGTALTKNGTLPLGGGAT